jgi:hypothetical protein
MEKPMSQRLHERFFGGSPNLGVAYPIAEPLPESDSPIIRGEDQQETALIIDGIATPKPKPAPESLFAVVTGRLQATKPRDKARAKQVAQALADVQGLLLAADELVATIDEERLEDLHQTWEALQNEGRALRHRIESELTAAVNTAMMNWNECEAKKVRAAGVLQARIDERTALKKERYSSKQQLADADRKVSAAVAAHNASKALHLEAERKKAEVENAKRLASSRLRGIELKMDAIAAEIQGVAFHDPDNFGLSTAIPVPPKQ